MLNVRDISEKQCAENEEIQNLVRILGLKFCVGIIIEGVDLVRSTKILHLFVMVIFLL